MTPNPQSPLLALSAPADVVEALTIFTRCAYPCDKSIDHRGYSWCESYLDQALSIGQAALASLNVEEKVGLPELPIAAAFLNNLAHNPLFTADQMRAYATEAAAYWKEMHRAANARGDGNGCP